MPETTDSNVPKVFISSTVEDLREYREAAREAALRAGFYPVMQEYFSASSAYPPFETCMKKVEECDVLIVLVAHRHGWTPKDQPAVDGNEGTKSITRLECERAQKRGMAILPFMVDKEFKWPLDLREEGRLALAAQQGKLTPEIITEVPRNIGGLTDFKNWLSGFGIKGDFTIPENLGKQVIQALNEWKKLNEVRDAGPITVADDPRPYLRMLLKECDTVEIRGLQVSGGKAYNLDIEDIYTPLYAAAGLGGEEDMRKREGGMDFGHRKVNLDEVVKKGRAVIVGDPGSGKSTFLKRIATILCRTLLGDRPEEAKEKLGVESAPMPLYIRINSFAEHLRVCDEQGCKDRPKNHDSVDWIFHYLASRSAESSSSISMEFLKEKCKNGNAALLIDGLDEAPGRSMRERIAAVIDRASMAFEKCSFVVTTRLAGYEGRAMLDRFLQCTIAELEDDGIRTFLALWSDAVYKGDKSRAMPFFNNLSQAVIAKPEIRRMAKNPVMLTALAVLYWNDKRLPDQRAELYESVITWLLRARQDRPGRLLGEDLGRRVYQKLALEMQRREGGRLRQIDKGQAKDAILSLMPDAPLATKAETALRFIEEDELDSGIIVSRGNKVEFWHLIFQEFLAAKEISGFSEKEQIDLFLGSTGSRLHDPEWREVILLFIGVLYKQGVGKVNVFLSAMMNGLVKAEQEAAREGRLAFKARCFGLLGAMVSDLSPYNYKPDKRYLEIRDQVMGIFDKEKSGKVDVKTRCAAAEALGQAGDPRISDDLRTEQARKGMFVPIPGGEFLMGAQKRDPKAANYDKDAYDQGDWNESPVHEVELSAFSIQKYPVTVSQYQKFVEESGYDIEKLWENGGFGKYKSPEKWEDQLQFPNRPVVSVSWFEAMAFCKWAGLMLPSEAQWERAARGTYKEYLKYPWGNSPEPNQDLANFHETGIGHPSPVGIFPAGATIEESNKELFDMAGNVWEWCLDRLGPYREKRQINPANIDKGEYRVLRGGSWNYYPMDLRSSNRGGNYPGNRYDDLGFRVVLPRY